ncbi:LOW QUALITY PROTEIN: protein argonaute 7-like [Dioscorea cayenensis subsp. rotundata]|uniref:Protein argonaute 7 n=1 Tax=Dioscorea cayennensis subsp. rotundata TaxID=55577 RepID=A0AB40AIX0_DIOCR|nr:LOW QUALITY PROTEIN: protein argonaute 7-like [Dioscorea cayenensis subsp. rotundata]
MEEGGEEGKKGRRKWRSGCSRPMGVKPQQPATLVKLCHSTSYPALLPLPLHLPLPPPLLLHLPSKPLVHYGTGARRSTSHAQDGRVATLLPLPHAVNVKSVSKECQRKPMPINPEAMLVAPRPDSGGTEGLQVSLLANHFLVKFDSKQRIFHYDVDITPRPSKELSRMIKRKLVQENSDALSGALPVFDGRRNLYSPVEFQDDRLEFFISLPIPITRSSPPNGGVYNMFETLKIKTKLFRVNIRLASKITGEDLDKYLREEKDGIPLPQDYLHALDVVLRESSSESCISVGRALYSSSMGGAKDIGGGAVGMRGFFQSLRPTKQGLSLNVDFSLMAFHESIGVIPYLQKRCDFLRDLSQRKTRGLTREEKKEVEKALKNIRVFVNHRETNQRYRVYCLTEEVTENLKFRDRDGKDLMLVDYFKDQYSLDIQYKNLPCLQISRNKPCYLPMELCMVCEGQKFLGKLSDEQTVKILKMGCQKPAERKDIINGVMGAKIGPLSGPYAGEFKLNVSREMTKLCGRVLQPPKLKLGDGGNVRDITPNRYDRQWNLLDSHVAEGSKIKRWALISFGGNMEQRSCIPRFINQLSTRCEQLGIVLNKNTVISPLFEQIQVLNNVSVLEDKLRKIHEVTSNNLQLLICVMEKKHRGYADLKRIAETGIGVMSQCCLYSNISRLSSQFLSNLALKINAKLGGCNVALYNTLPRQIPRLFMDDEPVIFMGADVTHPHPLDDFSPSVAAVVGSMNWPAANKYISRMRSQTHRQEIIEELEEMVVELLEEFYLAVHQLPKIIIFFRDGVSETQFSKVLKEELQAIRRACLRFPAYKPSITFAVVQKRHHTRLFLNDKNGSSSNHFSDENIPPGTVVDTVITHPREFDFYLCSHWGVKGTSRPTHYHVLWDENRFKSDEIQKLIHNLCYTFARCTKPVSLVPPAYYAHLAAYRGRLYLDRTDSMSCSRTTLSRTSPLRTAPLPKLRDNVKRLMFYC